MSASLSFPKIISVAFPRILYSLPTAFGLHLLERHADSVRFFRNLHVDVLVLRRNVTFVRSPSSVCCTKFSGLCDRTGVMQIACSCNLTYTPNLFLSVLIFPYAFARHVCNKCVHSYQSVSNIEGQNSHSVLKLS